MIFAITALTVTTLNICLMIATHQSKNKQKEKTANTAPTHYYYDRDGKKYPLIMGKGVYVTKLSNNQNN